MVTILNAIERYLDLIATSRSPRTEKSYRNALNAFCAALAKAHIDPRKTPVSRLSEDAVITFIKFLKDKSPATENQYIAAATGFFHFLAAERLAEPNLPRLRELVKQRSRKLSRRLPQFPRREIEILIEYSENLAIKDVINAGDAAKTETARLTERKRARLRNLRDRAFILFLADTGLRVDEACSLSLGDVDFLEGRLTVIGKGDEQASVRISVRALAALKDYLKARQAEPLGSGRKGKSLPLFTRHDRGAENKAMRITTMTGWNIVKTRAREAVGPEAAEQIHPHSFRHYFVTAVLLATNNMEITRRLARHKSIVITQRYVELGSELDEKYEEIFNERR